MNIMIVDDEKMAIDYFLDIAKNLHIDKDVVCFQKISEAIQYVEHNEVDVAFLDIEMPGMSGVNLADNFRETNPDMVIVFVTGHPQYALEAFDVDAIGYLLKPYTEAQIQKSLMKCKRMRGVSMKKRVYVKTFGGFDIYVDDKPLHFRRSKAKELLALLIDKRGSSLSSAQIAIYLWEDREYDDTIKDYLKKISQSLRKTLRDAGVESILIESHNSKAINIMNLTCDYYEFLAGVPEARRQYMGIYMENYSWAEDTNGELYQMKYSEQ